MTLVRVLRNGQVTMPKQFRERLGINEGDIMEVRMESTKVIFKPMTVVEKTEALAVAEQKKILSALKAHAEGQSKEFTSVEELIEDLNS